LKKFLVSEGDVVVTVHFLAFFSQQNERHIKPETQIYSISCNLKSPKEYDFISGVH